MLLQLSYRIQCELNFTHDKIRCSRMAKLVQYCTANRLYIVK